jgi:hypothetical protein
VFVVDVDLSNTVRSVRGKHYPSMKGLERWGYFCSGTAPGEVPNDDYDRSKK